MEALCLDTHLENTNNDELKINPCSINEQVLGEHIFDETFVDDASFCDLIDSSRTEELVSKGDELENRDTFEFFPATKDEYYEVFPRDSVAQEEYYGLYPIDAIKGKMFDFTCKYLILLLNLSREVCSPHMAHQSSFVSNTFIYMTPMHCERVILRPGYNSK